ncbi:TIGR03643 family protein [Kiloniella sp. b19]|uniref:TIGR03643 family protein n=1 Tax=Kiloniella sp. GXU_MW_B19 TaxID=3141326 RepID=UPI0031D30D83
MTRMSPSAVSELIELAWCDKTSFEDIRHQTGLSETETLLIMRRNLKPSSFRLWRKRVTNRNAGGRISKHRKNRNR